MLKSMLISCASQFHFHLGIRHLFRYLAVDKSKAKNTHKNRHLNPVEQLENGRFIRFFQGAISEHNKRTDLADAACLTGQGSDVDS